MHNHKLILGIGLALTVVAILVGTGVLGKQELQGSQIKVYIIKTTQTFQDLNAAASVAVMDLPPGADILSFWALVTHGFENISGDNELLGSWEIKFAGMPCPAPAGSNSGPLIFKGITSAGGGTNDVADSGQPLAGGSLCSRTQTQILMINPPSDLTQGTMDFVATYVIH